MNVILIGGGEIARGETAAIDQQIKSMKPAGTRFVFVGTAAHDAPGYAEKIAEAFGDHFDVQSPTVAAGRDAMQAALQQADVIYLGGGETARLVEQFTSWELVDVLRGSIDRGVVIVGMSAGALALAEWYIHDEDGEFEIRTGWGILAGVGVMAHAHAENQARAAELIQQSAQYQDATFYAIAEGEAVVC